MLLEDGAKFGHSACTKVMRKAVKSKPGEPHNGYGKEILVSKKTAPTTKSNSAKAKVDTSKPAASKVVAARKLGNGWL